MNNQLLAAAVTGCLAQLVSADIINVPQDHATIQAAIDAAVDGDEIIVAPGLYPEHEIRLLGKAITVRSSHGAEATIIERQYGDGNGHTVIICDQGEGPDTSIDGFTIRQGGVDAYDPFNEYLLGGGFRIEDSSPDIRNCIVAENWVGGIEMCSSGFGGGMYLSNASPTVTACTFFANAVTTTEVCAGQGGAVYSGGGNPSFLGCDFLFNTAGLGGGVRVASGNPVFIDCDFANNSASLFGGGFHGELSLMLHCRFDWNHADFHPTEQGGAGALLTYGGSIIGCVFTRNHTSMVYGLGGAIRADGNPTIAGCTFVANVAHDGGGAIANPSGAASIVNCTFTANETTIGSGGALWIGPDAEPAVAVANSILWGNAPGEIEDVAGATMVSYSAVLGGWPGTGNVDAAPMFIDADGPDDVYGTDDDDLRLLNDSPCIDAGDAALLPPDTFDLDGDGDTDEPLPLDLDGNPRVVGANVDMGAYEFQGLPCPADLDGDDVVDVADLTAVILAWGTPDGDVTGDGTTDVQDLVAVIGAWGSCA